MAKIVHLIEVEESRGSGTEEDPYRSVTVLYTLDGKMLCELGQAKSIKILDYVSFDPPVKIDMEEVFRKAMESLK